MRKICNTVLTALTGAWKKQMDIPLPRVLRTTSGDAGSLECAAFPVLGWLCGAVAALPGVITGMVFTPFAGALLFALCAWLLLTFRDSGKSDATLAVIIADALPGEAIPWRITVPVLLMIIKFMLLSAIFLCGNAWHLPLVLGAAFTMEALLTLDGDFMPPLLNDEPDSRSNMWIATVTLLFISFLLCRLPSALSALAFALIWKIFQNRTEKNGGTTLAEISLAGGITTWISLIIGALVI